MTNKNKAFAKKLILLALTFVVTSSSFINTTRANTLKEKNPIVGLLERIDKGASKKFKIELIENGDPNIDFFELDNEKNKIVVRGNNYVSIATGINWYLKYYANIHLSWNGMQATLPKKLPKVDQKIRKETDELLRYYLNYCTFSYSMAFWDWERWQQEIDWMALHGINLSLEITGSELSQIDYFDMDETWSKSNNTYSSKPVGNSVDVAKKVFR